MLWPTPIPVDNRQSPWRSAAAGRTSVGLSLRPRAAGRCSRRSAGSCARRAWAPPGLGALQQCLADRDPPAEQRRNHRGAAPIAAARAHRQRGRSFAGRSRATPIPTASSSARPTCCPDSSSTSTTTCSRMQALTQAFDRDDLRQIVLESLAEHFPECSLVERVDPHIRELEQLPARESQLVRGERSSTIFTMNGVRFHFDGLGGQKTGAFLDQRENYAAAARYAPWRGARLLHLSGRLRAAPGAGVRERDRALTRRARRWKSPSRTSNSIAPRTAAARSNGSRPTPSTCSRTTPPPDGSTTPSSSTRPPSPRPSAPCPPRCAATRSSTCAP